MSLATVASVIGIAGGVNSLTGGGITNMLGMGHSGQQGGSGNSSTYVPTGLGQSDTIWQDILKNLQTQQGAGQNAMQPAFADSLSKMLGLDTSGLTQAGQQAGAQYGGLSNLAQMYSQMMGNQAGTNIGAQGRLMGAGDQLWNTALDPQNALRNRMQQQVTDASRAGTSARGIGMGGAAAGLENQDVSNFLMDWQNQQLARQAQGLQGMTGAYGQAGQQGRDATTNLQSSLNAGALAPQFMQQSGLVPFQMSQMAAQWPGQAAAMYGDWMNKGVYGPQENLMQLIIPYLNSGQGATNQAFNQGQVGLNNLTTGLGQIGKGLGNINWPSFSGGGGYSGSNIGGYTDMYTQAGGSGDPGGYGG